ncbi:hypothetical protein SUGI_0205940 [Cryptomeria japonica]|nr:hypothetical protein SUGI_0205940 [Cryptomeria japonica]
MVRGKVQLELIQNPKNRRVTFSKRKGGLLKKASELSILCDAEVALIIFSPSGKLHEFASSSMNRILRNYATSCCLMGQQTQSSQNKEKIPMKVESLQKCVRKLDKKCKNMLGEDLDSLSFKELEVLERKINSSVRNIRSKKEKMSLEYIAFLKAKVR